MISAIVAIYCSATSCLPVEVPFYGAPTPAACERELRKVEPAFLAENPQMHRESMRCDAPGDGA